MVTNAANIANVSGIEILQLNAGGAQTLTMNDLAMGMNDGSTITVNANTNQAHVVVASGVLNNSSTVNLTASAGVTANVTYTVGNAIDNLVFNAADGEITVANSAYLSATDTVTGGSSVT